MTDVYLSAERVHRQFCNLISHQAEVNFTLEKSMNRYCSQEDRGDIRQRAMNLAMTCAINKSSRSGFGWVLLDSQGAHLSSGGFIIGERGNTAAIVEQLEQHAFGIRELIITGTPVAAMLDLSELLPAIENSSCEVITIGFDSELLIDAQWQEWLNTKSHKVCHLPENQISARLHTGPTKLQLSGLPWVTGVLAGTFSHHPLKLTDVCSEFGINAHIKSMASQYLIALYTPNQKDILSLLSKEQTGNEAISYIEVASIDDVTKALRKAAADNHTCILLLCDSEFLKQGIQYNLYDEIVYHISFSVNEKSQPKTSSPIAQFENWAIQNCETVGRCIRLTLEREYQSNIVPPLSVRLN